jgi:hypothetical protein
VARSSHWTNCCEREECTHYTPPTVAAMGLQLTPRIKGLGQILCADQESKQDSLRWPAGYGCTKRNRFGHEIG